MPKVGLTMSRLSRASGYEAGAAAVEYALMALLIAVAIFAAVQALGQSLPAPFEQADEAFSAE
jgi:Flp pilus assembly pilin Flp